jgi:hypothetical protein
VPIPQGIADELLKEALRIGVDISEIAERQWRHVPLQV